MNLPPKITQVCGLIVADSTAMVAANVVLGEAQSIPMVSTDPEGDPITCGALFLQDGMSFNPATCTLAWTPSGPVGKTFYVKFRATTPSGGTDAVIGAFTVVSSLGPSALAPATHGEEPLGPNPTRAQFAILAPTADGVRARLSIFDVRGRRVTVVEGPSGSRLVWEGRDAVGNVVGAGIYLYRLEVGKLRQQGRVVVVR